MGQVHHTLVSLDHLTSSSSHVLVVSAADPPSRDVMYEPARLDPTTGEPYTFAFKLRRLRVEAVLAGTDLAREDVVEVEPAELDNEYDLNFDYDVVGIDESPDYLTYAPLAEPHGPQWIVFLTRGQRGYRYTMMGSAEGIESLDHVRQVLQTSPVFSEGVVLADWDDEPS